VLHDPHITSVAKLVPDMYRRIACSTAAVVTASVLLNSCNEESKRTTPVLTGSSEHTGIQINTVVGSLNSVHRTALPRSSEYTHGELKWSLGSQGSWLKVLIPVANCDETSKPHNSTTEKFDSMVLEVTGNTFTKDVLQSEADVFVVFYAPWCGYCKRLCKCGAAISRLWSVYGSLRYQGL
jgi:hypothetical protein